MLSFPTLTRFFYFHNFIKYLTSDNYLGSCWISKFPEILWAKDQINSLPNIHIFKRRSSQLLPQCGFNSKVHFLRLQQWGGKKKPQQTPPPQNTKVTSQDLISKKTLSSHWWPVSGTKIFLSSMYYGMGAKSVMQEEEANRGAERV